MKICMYNVTTTIKSGGIETFYWEVSRELNKRKIDIEIISGKGKYIKYDDIPLKMFNFISRDRILNLGSRFRKWGERISFFLNAFSYLKNKNFDYYLIHKPMDFFIAYFIKKIYPNTKFIFVSGGEDFYGFDKYFSRYIDFMFAVSNENKNIIETRYNKEVKVLHNGVDIDHFKPMPEIRGQLRKKYGLENKKVLISVGRIVPLKGYQLVLEAIKNTDYYYVLIGRGEYLSELKNKVRKLKLENRVFFLGEINNKELPKYLNMGDVFIQPTISHEAFGITLIEAMACGLPVVASFNGGMKDIVDQTCGLFFETGNVEDLRKKLDEVWKYDFDPRKKVVNNFTWEKSVNRLLQWIRE